MGFGFDPQTGAKRGASKPEAFETAEAAVLRQRRETLAAENAKRKADTQKDIARKTQQKDQLATKKYDIEKHMRMLLDRQRLEKDPEKRDLMAQKYTALKFDGIQTDFDWFFYNNSIGDDYRDASKFGISL